MNQSDHRNESTCGHYTFGDNAVTAVRLQRLADLFRPSLETFVTEHLPRPIGHVLDLGCGPGHTTRALAALLTVARVTGLDDSASFIEEAARTPVPNVVYRVADVTQPRDAAAPGVLPPADGLYSRFLLTHLPRPGEALSTWATYLTTGAVCLLQETGAMKGSHRALARYYELVADLQRRHGQRLDIGRALSDLPDRRLYDVRYSGERRFSLPGSRMAELHRLNLMTWRHDPLAASFDPHELESLEAELSQIAAGLGVKAVVEYSMGELVVERR
jgi:trans-aconitate 2-methyltransferase